MATDEGIGDDAVTKKSTEDAFEVVVVAANDAPKKPASSLADPDDVLEDTSPTYVFDAFDGRAKLLAVLRTRLFGRRGIRLGGIS